MQDVPCARLIVLGPSVSCISIWVSQYVGDKSGIVTNSYSISFSILALHVINARLNEFAVYQGKEGRE